MKHILFQVKPSKNKKNKNVFSVLGNSLNYFLRPCDQGKRQLKDMQFWNWGPTIIWHNLGCEAFYFSKSLHPTVLYTHCVQHAVLQVRILHLQQ